MEQDCMRFHHSTQNSALFIICELINAGILHLLYADHDWPPVTETKKSKITDKGDDCIIYNLDICSLEWNNLLSYWTLIHRPPSQITLLVMGLGMMPAYCWLADGSAPPACWIAYWSQSWLPTRTRSHLTFWYYKACSHNFCLLLCSIGQLPGGPLWCAAWAVRTCD